MSVGIAVIDEFVGAGIADLDGRVGDGTLGRPAQVVACRLGDEERLGASHVLVGVDAFLDGKIENGTGGHVRSWRCGVDQRRRQGNTRVRREEEMIEVFKVQDKGCSAGRELECVKNVQGGILDSGLTFHEGAGKSETTSDETLKIGDVHG